MNFILLSFKTKMTEYVDTIWGKVPLNINGTFDTFKYFRDNILSSDYDTESSINSNINILLHGLRGTAVPFDSFKNYIKSANRWDTRSKSILKNICENIVLYIYKDVINSNYKYDLSKIPITALIYMAINSMLSSKNDFRLYNLTDNMMKAEYLLIEKLEYGIKDKLIFSSFKNILYFFKDI